MVLKTGSKIGYMTIKKEKELKILAEKYSITALALSIEAIGFAREQLNFNVTPISVVEKLLFSMLENAYLYKD